MSKYTPARPALDAMALTTRLRELMEEATQLPWPERLVEIQTGDLGKPLQSKLYTVPGLGILASHANEALALALANNAPTIIRLLEAVDGAEKALATIRNLCANWSNAPDFNPTVTEVHEFANSALATLRAAREGAR